MASSSSRPSLKTETGNLDMVLSEKGKRFVCPNFASDYMAGVVVLPKEFGMQHGQELPERLLLHVPPGTVWNGTYSKQRNWIEGVEKMMVFYSIKPYHLIAFQYMGGPSFNIQIYNPYAVEINYSISNKCQGIVGMDRSYLDISDIEVDKLCGTMAYNAYNSGHGVYDLIISKTHLKKKDYYKILKRKACRKLGVVDSMEWLKLSFKNLTWVVKLKWRNGKMYMDKKWYDFAKAGKFKEGDTCVFQMTGKAQKFLIFVYDTDVHTKCNIKGVGHATGVMNWFKIVNEVTLYTGRMEIPRVFIDMGGATLNDRVNLLMADGESVEVVFCSRRNFLHGLKKMLCRYCIELHDVMLFTYVSDSTFGVSFFKSCGMEFHNIAEESPLPIEMENAGGENIILLSDSSMEVVEDDAVVPAENMVIDVPGDAIENRSFRITLKSSHVDKRGHGMYCPRLLYSYYATWRNNTTVSLICGNNTFTVSVLRRDKMCRFGKGWNEFIVANDLVKGQILEVDYVADKTFEIRVVG